MGCGKSSVGRRLSELLCCRFMDLDLEIERVAGRSIPEIFESEGEYAFRRMEKDRLGYIVSMSEDSVGPRLRYAAAPPSRGWQNANFVQQTYDTLQMNSDFPNHMTHPELVLSLGGGTVMTRECAEIIRERTVCVYLRASVETLTEHLRGETQGRPMLKGNVRERITSLMAQRSSTYESTAHIIIDIDGKSVDEVAENIRNAIERSQRRDI